MNLLVSDFDGTFFDKNYYMNIDYINNNKENFDFAIATGRSMNSLLKDLKISCKYYICNDGGYILDDKKNIIYKNYIDNHTIETIYARILELGYNEFYFDDINSLYKKPVENINKVIIKLNNQNNIKNMENIMNGLDDVYAYISTNWINIISINSTKSNAINYILNNENYKNVYTVGNDINDYDMLDKYNGYLVTNEINSNFNCINNFLELEKIIKKSN